MDLPRTDKGAVLGSRRSHPITRSSARVGEAQIKAHRWIVAPCRAASRRAAAAAHRDCRSTSELSAGCSLTPDILTTRGERLFYHLFLTICRVTKSPDVHLCLMWVVACHSKTVNPNFFNEIDSPRSVQTVLSCRVQAKLSKLEVLWE